MRHINSRCQTSEKMIRPTCQNLGDMYPVEILCACGNGEAGPRKVNVVVGSSMRMTDALAQLQEEYTSSSYLREIEEEIQHQRQLALALNGVHPLQPREDGPTDQRWATSGATMAMPRIRRQNGCP